MKLHMGQIWTLGKSEKDDMWRVRVFPSSPLEEKEEESKDRVMEL